MSNSAVLKFKPELKKYVNQFLVKFGKFPPENVTVCVAKDGVVLQGSTPGTSVSLNAMTLLESLDSKTGFKFTVSKDSLTTLANCNAETGTVTLFESFVQVKSGRMTLELPIEELIADRKYRDAVDNPLSDEFQTHLKYALPLMKKTSSSVARSELFLECATEYFPKFNIAAVVGTKIHLITSTEDCESVYQNETGGISVLAPFDLLEGIQSTEEANLVLDNNTLIVTELDCTSSTQTREHSLGINYDIVLKKVKEIDHGAVIFSLKASRFMQMMTDLPKPPTNSEYTLVFTLEKEMLTLVYKGKGVRFTDALKVVTKEPITEKKEFSVEYQDVFPVSLVLAEISERSVFVLSDNRLVIKSKSDLGYNHFIALSRVM